MRRDREQVKALTKTAMQVHEESVAMVARSLEMVLTRLRTHADSPFELRAAGTDLDGLAIVLEGLANDFPGPF